MLALAGGVVLFVFFFKGSRSFGVLPGEKRTLRNDVSIPFDSSEQLVISEEKEASVQQGPAGVAGVLFAYISEEALLTTARSRIALSVEGALAWAQAQADPGDQARLLFAVVRAWGERDPFASVRWALSRPAVRTEPFMEAALTGAARMPELAMAVGRSLLAEDAELGSAYGMTLVGALTSVGEFKAAFQFANAAPPDLREEWLASAFHRWGAQNPEEAINALNALTDETTRAPAFRALAAGWAEGDPATLAAYVYLLSRSAEREYVLGEALSHWAMRDPRSLAIWLNTLSPGPEFDAGAAVLLAHTDQANRSIDVGLQWVESISESVLRRDSLRNILADWQQSEPEGAREYLGRISWINAEERSLILQSLNADLRGEPEAGT